MSEMPPEIFDVVLSVSNKTYSSWSFRRVEKDENIYPHTYFPYVVPSSMKMFNGDIIRNPQSFTPSISNSRVRDSPYIPGVLVLKGNKTYGRTLNKKKLLYMCVPRDPLLPEFIIPYEIKINFSKLYINKYILFKFDSWTEKHPMGIIVDNIGDVSHLPNFYEYELYARSLHSQNKKIAEKTRILLNAPSKHVEMIDDILKNEDFDVTNRIDTHRVITIDPSGSSDFDDGLSIRTLDNGRISISIYIANVYVWVETLKLWHLFGERTSTVYMPDYKRPMLPAIMSEELCSLKKNNRRFAMVLDINMSENGDDIKFESLRSVMIQVSENYSYDDPKLLNDVSYKMLLKMTSLIDSTIIDSRDVVAHWMITMNKYCAEFMHLHKLGIFRISSSRKKMSVCDVAISTTPLEMSLDEKNNIRNWKSGISGDYVAYSEDSSLINNEMGGVIYAHTSSPIRRIVDLINQTIMMRLVHKKSSIDSDMFVELWMSRIDMICRNGHSISSLSRICNLLHLCHRKEQTTSLLNGVPEETYEGIWLSPETPDDFRWVYLRKLKITCRAKFNNEYNNPIHPEIGLFRIVWFSCESGAYKKVRVMHTTDGSQ
jgi:hypothetical protein